MKVIYNCYFDKKELIGALWILCGYSTLINKTKQTKIRSYSVLAENIKTKTKILIRLLSLRLSMLVLCYLSKNKSRYITRHTTIIITREIYKSLILRETIYN